MSCAWDMSHLAREGIRWTLELTLMGCMAHKWISLWGERTRIGIRPQARLNAGQLKRPWEAFEGRGGTGGKPTVGFRLLLRTHYYLRVCCMSLLPKSQSPKRASALPIWSNKPAASG